jgi:hypothetical protein
VASIPVTTGSRHRHAEDAEVEGPVEDAIK